MFHLIKLNSAARFHQSLYLPNPVGIVWWSVALIDSESVLSGKSIGDQLDWIEGSFEGSGGVGGGATPPPGKEYKALKSWKLLQILQVIWHLAPPATVWTWPRAPPFDWSTWWPLDNLQFHLDEKGNVFKRHISIYQSTNPPNLLSSTNLLSSLTTPAKVTCRKPTRHKFLALGNGKQLRPNLF